MYLNSANLVLVQAAHKLSQLEQPPRLYPSMSSDPLPYPHLQPNHPTATTRDASDSIAKNLAESPIFAEIVPEKSRTSIYALDRSFESVLSSFAPPIVGILAQRVYGYRPDDKGRSVRLDRENAASLAKALYTAIAIPFTVCTAIYSFLYCSYPRDRDRARMQSLVESELHQMEHEGSRLEDGDGDGDRDGVNRLKESSPEDEKDTVKLLSDV